MNGKGVPGKAPLSRLHIVPSGAVRHCLLQDQEPGSCSHPDAFLEFLMIEKLLHEIVGKIRPSSFCRASCYLHSVVQFG